MTDEDEVGERGSRVGVRARGVGFLSAEWRGNDLFVDNVYSGHVGVVEEDKSVVMGAVVDLTGVITFVHHDMSDDRLVSGHRVQRARDVVLKEALK